MTDEQSHAVVQSLGRIEGVLEQLVDRIDDHVLNDKEFHADVEQRLRKAEGFRAYAAGIAAAVALISTQLKDALFGR